MGAFWTQVARFYVGEGVPEIPPLNFLRGPKGPLSQMPFLAEELDGHPLTANQGMMVGMSMVLHK
ncbi:hypothetical protein JZU71_05130 [bacterium]|nr:hypothetical protein [bacterium]